MMKRINKVVITVMPFGMLVSSPAHDFAIVYSFSHLNGEALCGRKCFIFTVPTGKML